MRENPVTVTTLTTEPLLRFFVPGTPRAQGSNHVAGATKQGRLFVRVTDGAELTSWRKSVATVARAAMLDARVRLVEGAPIFGVLTFTRLRPRAHLNAAGDIKPKHAASLPITKPDYDKLARAVSDALTGVFYRDDAQCTTMLIRKRFAQCQGALVELWFDHSDPDFAVEDNR